MRLTCPNCGAQYEVPDEVIPQDGRDVQCSNCGDTWFQVHPSHADAEPKSDGDDAEPGSDIWDDDLDDDLDDAEVSAAPEPEPEPEPEEEPEPEDEPEPEAEPEPEPEPERKERRDLDPAVANILRQEAEHEARLRAAESGQGLESQPDLGLDDLPSDEAGRRSREARDRMARMRGETPETSGESSSRSGLLPDIEEINSTLRASGDGSTSHASADTALSVEPTRGGGFTRGFGLIVLLTIILVLLYTNSTKLSQSVPQIAPALDAYVGLVDKGRVWLDGQVSEFMPQ
jgi:predicted Zn finger-like uncharacterized protein